MFIKLLCLLLLIIYVNCDKRIVCYFLDGNPIENLDPHLCTHIHYSFAKLDTTSLQLNVGSGVDSLKRLKTANPNIKLILAVGGGSDSGDGNKYSRMVASAQTRATFVNNAVQALVKHGLDGLDMDWEYPACPQTNCDAAHASEKGSFGALLKELRTAFDKHSPKFSLSTAVNVGKWMADKAYDFAAFNSALDYVNLMTYDNAGSWDKKTGHHAGFDWVKTSVQYWSQHITKSKLNVGVPFYGVSFTLSNPSTHGLGAPITASNAERYLQICNEVKKEGFKKEYINNVGDIAYKGNHWVGYDDAQSIAQKAEWVRDNGLGGVMIWEINQDDIHGACCKTARPLLNAVNFGLLSKGPNPSGYGCE